MNNKEIIAEILFPKPIDVYPLFSEKVLLITYSNGARKLLDLPKVLSDCDMFKKVIRGYNDFSCVKICGYGIIWEDKNGVFFELPALFAYEQSTLIETYVSSRKRGITR